MHATEPMVTDWQRIDETGLRRRLVEAMPPRGLVLVDGRSGAGKSTFATLAARLLTGSGRGDEGPVTAAVVHTDDVAWHHSVFDWDDLLRTEIIEPWRAGRPVAWQPPGWRTHDRPGQIEVPVCDRLIVEGLGAARASLAPLASLTVWLQSDPVEARTRGIARDIELGRTPDEAEQFWDDWAPGEEAFFVADRPWHRVDLVVNGTPAQTGRIEVAHGPLEAGG